MEKAPFCKCRTEYLKRLAGKKRKGVVIRMSKFEKKFGRYAIKNLSLVLIGCYVIGYVIQLLSPQLEAMLTLNPYAILHGQIWRLVTWILIPPSSLDLFTIIMLLFYYSIGTSLEMTWGTYRYNVYLFSGMLFTIIGSFLAMGLYYLLTGDAGAAAAPQMMQTTSTLFSTYYINMSIFLAYAATFPDAQVLLMFVIPVKMKWMGIAYSVLLAVEMIQGTGYGVYDIFYRFAIAASLLNFVIFVLISRRKLHISPAQMRRRQQFKAQTKANKNPGITKHKCAICGRTEKDDPDLEFRFCSKCNGNYEYCQYHLFTHEHIK